MIQFQFDEHIFQMGWNHQLGMSWKISFLFFKQFAQADSDYLVTGVRSIQFLPMERCRRCFPAGTFNADWTPNKICSLKPTISIYFPRASPRQNLNLQAWECWFCKHLEFRGWWIWFPLEPIFPVFPLCCSILRKPIQKLLPSYGMVWALHFSQVLGATWMVGKEERTLGTKSKRYWISDKSNNYIIYTYIYTIYVCNIYSYIHIVLAFASTI